jgi:hypothetical protein
MAGDVVFSATLKDDGVSRGLRAIDQAAENTARKGDSLGQAFGKYGGGVAKWAVPGYMAIKAIGAVMDLQKESLTAYAAKNDMVAASLERQSAAHKKVMEDMGREISYGQTLGGVWDSVKDKAIEAYTATVKFAAEQMSKIGQGGQGAANMAEADAAMRAQEQLAAEGKTSAIVFMEGLRAQEEMLRNQDDILGADFIRARIQKLEELKAVADRVAKEGLTQGGGVELKSGVEAKFQSRVDKANADEAERQAAKEKARQEEQAQIRKDAQAADKEYADKGARVRAAEREFTVERELNALRAEAIGKSEKEREVLAERISLRQTLYDIEKDSSLNAAQKDVLSSEATLLSARQIEAMMARTDDKARTFSASVSAGAGGVFGAGNLTGLSVATASQRNPGLDEARAAVKLAQQQVDKLKEIADSMKRMASGSDVPKFAL